jgi:CDP-6-deoxy-D-xylo-4-hexulose-3-dehydrase
MFPIRIREQSGVRRGELQQWMEGRGIDTRMVWSGNILRQPAFAKIAHRAPPEGLPNADRVMETGLVLPCHHAMDDADVDYLCETLGAFLAQR